jgi:amino acid transporter
MNKQDVRELQQELKYLQIGNASFLSSIPLLHFTGYGILILTAIQVAAIIIPVNLFDPYWQLETLAKILDCSPIFLVGLIFIFYGKDLYRDRREKYLLKILHHLALATGTIFILLIPLGIIDTNVIYQSHQQQDNLPINSQVAMVSNTYDLINLLNQQPINQIVLNISQQGQVEQVKIQLLDSPQQSWQKLKNNLQVQQNNRFFYFVQTTFKSNIASLITGIILLKIWQKNKWIEL